MDIFEVSMGTATSFPCEGGEKKAAGTRILLSLLVRAQVERVCARLKSLVRFFIDVANILRGIVVS